MSETMKHWQRHLSQPLLTPEQEAILLTRTRAGCARSRTTLLERNLRLVVRYCRPYWTARFDGTIDDLLQVGALALQRAIDQFNPERAGKLSTVATTYIKRDVNTYIAINTHPLHLPRDLAIALRGARIETADTINADELAARLDVPRESATTMLTSRYTMRLDHSSPHDHDGDGRTLAETVTDPDTAGDHAGAVCQSLTTSTTTQAALDTLTPRERRFITRRFGLDGAPPATVNELANDPTFNIEPSSVPTLELHLLTRLQQAIDAA